MDWYKFVVKIVVKIALMLLLRSATLAASQYAAAGDSAAALLLCCGADHLSGAEKRQVLLRGLQLAQDAAAADPSDPQAHFAIFCNLGKEVQSRPLGWRDLQEIGRLRHEIDRVLELAPNDTDALVAKGALLLALPWFLGGDRRQGEGLLRAALIRDPANAAARGYLAEALKARGATGEARALTMRDKEVFPPRDCAQ